MMMKKVHFLMISIIQCGAQEEIGPFGKGRDDDDERNGIDKDDEDYLAVSVSFSKSAKRVYCEHACSPFKLRF